MRTRLTSLAALACILAACGSPSTTDPRSVLYPELILTNAERQEDVALKATRILELLNRESLCGVLIGRRSNYAWATSGAEGNVPLFLREDGRRFFIAQTDAVSGAAMDDLRALRYEPRVVPWYSSDIGQQGMTEVLQELSGGRPFGADVPCAGAKDVGRQIASVRVPLTAGEIHEYRWLGKKAATAVEAVCRRIQPGMTDQGVGTLLSDALMSCAIRVVLWSVESGVRVTGEDGKPRHDVSKIENEAIVSVCAERWGLKVELSRAVHFGPLTKESQEQLLAAARMNAAFWACTLPGAAVASIIKGAAAEGADTSGLPGWPVRNPGGAIGYDYPDWVVPPDSTQTIRIPQAFAWRASAGNVRVEDTILLVGEQMEVLTETQDWPRVESKALGRIYRSAGVLLR